jgi:hypothetical protein
MSQCTPSTIIKRKSKKCLVGSCQYENKDERKRGVLNGCERELYRDEWVSGVFDNGTSVKNPYRIFFESNIKKYVTLHKEKCAHS